MLKKMCLVGITISLSLVILSGCSSSPIPQGKELNKAGEKTQVAAVQRHPSNIMYIDNPSDRVILAAIARNHRVLGYVKHPSEEIQLKYIENGRACYKFRDINNPTERVQLLCINSAGPSLWNIFSRIKNPSEKVQLATVRQNGRILGRIKNPSEKVQLAAVKQNGEAIRYIKNPSEKFQLAAVKQNGNAIQYIENPSVQAVLVSLKTYTDNIEKITIPTITKQFEYFKAKNKEELALLEWKQGKKSEERKDYKQAFFWFKLASKNGYDSGDFQLGWLYLNGLGVKQDFLKAAQYFEKTTNKKLVIVGAHYNTCVAYYNAGVYDKALKYCKKSDLPDAYNVLGLMYEYGKGVKMDKIKAYKLYLKATKKGNQESQLNLDRLCKNSSWACK